MNTSADEDADLRDLVAHTLENNGVLGKIKVETFDILFNLFLVLMIGLHFQSMITLSKKDQTTR